MACPTRRDPPVTRAAFPESGPGGPGGPPGAAVDRGAAVGCWGVAVRLFFAVVLRLFLGVFLVTVWVLLFLVVGLVETIGQPLAGEFP